MMGGRSVRVSVTPLKMVARARPARPVPAPSSRMRIFGSVDAAGLVVVVTGSENGDWGGWE